MKKAILILLALASQGWAAGNITTNSGTGTITVTAGPLWNNGYSYRRTVTIDHSKVGQSLATNLSNFPMVFSSTYTWLSSNTVTGGMLSTGYDWIASTDPAGASQLYIDTETYNVFGASTSVAWINVPTVYYNTDTPLYIFYGNSSVTTYQGVSTATWDSNYKGVWHLSNGTTLGNGTYTYDSSSNTNTGTLNATKPVATAGQIDGAASFAGGAGSISASQPAMSALTYSCWAKGAANSFNHSYLISDATDATSIQISATAVTFSGGGNNAYKNFTFDDGAWHYVVGTVPTSGSLNIFIDGVQANGNGRLSNTAAAAIYMGNEVVYGYRFFLGQMDEVRISSIDRSADWIKTEYNNQFNPTSFYTVGPETSVKPTVTIQ